jgi:D-alanyl-D-alanine carboxypeptidase
MAQAGLSQGLIVRILSGTRTFAEQAAIFEKHQHGRPLAANPGHSNHNFGIAWDVGVFNERGAYIDDLIDKRAMTSKAVDAEYKNATQRKLNAYSATRLIKKRPPLKMSVSIPECLRFRTPLYNLQPEDYVIHKQPGL